MLLKNTKGQIAIEFIILVAILLLFFYSMLLPSIEFAEEVVDDTYKLVKTHESLTRLANNLESFSTNVGYGKRDIFIYLPGDAKITGCSGTNPYDLQATVTISPNNVVTNNCDSDTGVCDINVSFYSALSTVTCNTIPSGYRGYVTIEKTDAGVIRYETS